MKKVFGSFVALALVISIPAYAGEAADLAKQKQCLSCHSVDKDMIGPSFKNIAQRFNGMKNMQIMLEQAVMQGSATAPYHWGDTKMPSSGARVPVTQVEAMKLVEWILSLK